MSTPIVNPTASRPLVAPLWTSAILYTVLLTVASLLPSAGQAAGGWDSALSPTAQNMLHVPAYALLAVLWLTAAARSWPLGMSGAVTIALVCIVYGASLEWIQASAIPGRTGSYTDAFWNTIGGAGGCTGWLICRNIAGQPRS